MSCIVGWDVGGAHLKAAVWRDGRLQAVRQRACPLWLGLDRLTAAVDDVLAGLDITDARHALTMTGEMADGFADRADGVSRITAAMAQRLAPQAVHVFALDSGGGDPQWHAAADAPARWRSIASANWWATARWTASRVPAALLVDIGSTTTDLIAVRGGRVCAQGHTDHERLCSGELLYQGVVRTPLCALGAQIRWDGRDCGVMNEWFATTADVYRLTGELDPAHDQQPAADQGHKDADGSRQRLARMLGLDAADGSAAQWQALAEQYRGKQLDALAAALRRVVQAAALPDEAPLVAAGCGAFLAAELGYRERRPVLGWETLVDALGETARWAAVCAPSVAVAALRAAPAGHA